MWRSICFVVLIFSFYLNINGLDLERSWSLGDIGIENTNFEANISYCFNILNINRIEKNTGLGFRFTLFDYHRYKEDVFWQFAPIELIWSPLSKKIGKSNIFGTLNFYNRMGFGGIGESVLDTIYENTGFVNTTGIRYMFSIEPFGKANENRKNKYHLNSYIFSEYSTSNKWRIGISADIGFLLRVIIALPLQFIMEKPIPEEKF